APGGPQILLVLAADEALEVDPPNHIGGLHEVQGRKRNCDGSGPALFCAASLRDPYSIPSGIAVAHARLCAPLLCDQGIALRAQRIDLEDERVAAIVGRIDDDLEIVVEFLTDVAPELAGNDSRRIGVEALDAEIDFMLTVENTDL